MEEKEFIETVKDIQFRLSKIDDLLLTFNYSKTTYVHSNNTITFIWSKHATNVLVYGAFNNWSAPIQLQKLNKAFWGETLVEDTINNWCDFKFLVDGQWEIDNLSLVIDVQNQQFNTIFCGLIHDDDVVGMDFNSDLTVDYLDTDLAVDYLDSDLTASHLDSTVMEYNTESTIINHSKSKVINQPLKIGKEQIESIRISVEDQEFYQLLNQRKKNSIHQVVVGMDFESDLTVDHLDSTVIESNTESTIINHSKSKVINQPLKIGKEQIESIRISVEDQEFYQLLNQRKKNSIHQVVVGMDFESDLTVDHLDSTVIESNTESTIINHSKSKVINQPLKIGKEQIESIRISVEDQEFYQLLNQRKKNSIHQVVVGMDFESDLTVDYLDSTVIESNTESIDRDTPNHSQSKVTNQPLKIGKEQIESIRISVEDQEFYQLLNQRKKNSIHQVVVGMDFESDLTVDYLDSDLTVDHLDSTVMEYNAESTIINHSKSKVINQPLKIGKEQIESIRISVEDQEFHQLLNQRKKNSIHQVVVGMDFESDLTVDHLDSTVIESNTESIDRDTPNHSQSKVTNQPLKIGKEQIESIRISVKDQEFHQLLNQRKKNSIHQAISNQKNQVLTAHSKMELITALINLQVLFYINGDDVLVTDVFDRFNNDILDQKYQILDTICSECRDIPLNGGSMCTKCQDIHQLSQGHLEKDQIIQASRTVYSKCASIPLTEFTTNGTKNLQDIYKLSNEHAQLITNFELIVKEGPIVKEGSDHDMVDESHEVLVDDSSDSSDTSEEKADTSGLEALTRISEIVWEKKPDPIDPNDLSTAILTQREKIVTAISVHEVVHGLVMLQVLFYLRDGYNDAALAIDAFEQFDDGVIGESYHIVESANYIFGQYMGIENPGYSCGDPEVEVPEEVVVETRLVDLGSEVDDCLSSDVVDRIGVIVWQRIPEVIPQHDIELALKIQRRAVLLSDTQEEVISALIMLQVLYYLKDNETQAIDSFDEFEYDIMNQRQKISETASLLYTGYISSFPSSIANPTSQASQQMLDQIGDILWEKKEKLTSDQLSDAIELQAYQVLSRETLEETILALIMLQVLYYINSDDSDVTGVLYNWDDEIAGHQGYISFAALRVYNDYCSKLSAECLKREKESGLEVEVEYATSLDPVPELQQTPTEHPESLDCSLSRISQKLREALDEIVPDLSDDEESLETAINDIPYPISDPELQTRIDEQRIKVMLADSKSQVIQNLIVLQVLFFLGEEDTLATSVFNGFEEGVIEQQGFITDCALRFTARIHPGNGKLRALTRDKEKSLSSFEVDLDDALDEFGDTDLSIDQLSSEQVDEIRTGNENQAREIQIPHEVPGWIAPLTLVDGDQISVETRIVDRLSQEQDTLSNEQITTFRTDSENQESKNNIDHLSKEQVNDLRMKIENEYLDVLCNATVTRELEEAAKSKFAELVSSSHTTMTKTEIVSEIVSQRINAILADSKQQTIVALTMLQILFYLNGDDLLATEVFDKWDPEIFDEQPRITQIASKIHREYIGKDKQDQNTAITS